MKLIKLSINGETLAMAQTVILTGDIKLNPDAQCLIMTTEILRNKLSYLVFNFISVNYNNKAPDCLKSRFVIGYNQ